MDKIIEILNQELRPEQLEAVTCELPIVVVSAGAGTGKTHTLACRFAWLLASDADCAVDEILTLTFTEKAALEMQERIKNTLLNWQEYAPQLKQAVRDVDGAYISTIHSFASRVIKENAPLLDVSPNARIAAAMPEDDYFLRMEEALDRLDADFFLTHDKENIKNKEWDERVKEFFAKEYEALLDLVNEHSAKNLTNLIRTCAELHGSMGKEPTDLWDRKGMSLESAIFAFRQASAQKLRAARDDFEHAIATNMDEIIKGGTILADALDKFTYTYHFQNDISDEEYLITLLGGPLLKLPPSGKLKAKIADALGGDLKLWRDDIKPVLDILARSMTNFKDEDAYLDRICKMCAAGYRAFEDMRLQSGMLNFRDLISLASAALEKNPGYGRKFKHILIDEFQDTDPLQDNLIGALLNSQKTLFLVGDLKQSIYRFRHADLTIFDRYIRRAINDSPNCKLISLNCSFRMTQPLADFINALFGKIWSGGLGQNFPHRPYENIILPELPDLPHVGAPLAAHAPQFFTASKEADENTDDARKRLYQNVILNLLNIIKDNNLKYSDAAVLVPTRADYLILEEIFNYLGVPALFTKSMSFYTRGEISDIINYLYALWDIDMPNSAEDFALSAFMASPFSDVPFEEAQADFARTRKSARPEIRIALKKLAYMRKIAAFRGAKAALSALCMDDESLEQYPQPQRALANMRLAAQAAAEYEASMGPSLWGAASYMRMALRRNTPQEEPEQAQADAVTVQTVHSAKGLEFPAVAITRLEKGPQERGRSLGASRWFGVTSSAAPLSKDIEKIFEENDLREQWERVFYVACTRAKRFLLMAGISDKIDISDEMDKNNKKSNKKNKNSWLEILNECEDIEKFCDITEIKNGRMWTSAPTKHTGAPVGADVHIRPFTPLAINTQKIQKILKISASSYALYCYCPRAFRLRYRQGLSLDDITGRTSGEVGGADIGSICHRIMYQWDGNIANLRKYLPKNVTEIEQACRLMPPNLRPAYKDGRARDAIYEWLGAFAASDEGKLFHALVSGKSCEEHGFKVSREAHFSLSLEGMTLAGSIDLMWRSAASEKNKKIFIRDYKTTNEMHALDVFYEAQLKFYGLAAHLASGSEVDLEIWPLRPQKKPVYLGPYDWDEVKNHVLNTAEQMQNGPFEAKNKTQCAMCAFKILCKIKFMM